MADTVPAPEVDTSSQRSQGMADAVPQDQQTPCVSAMPNDLDKTTSVPVPEMKDGTQDDFSRNRHPGVVRFLRSIKCASSGNGTASPPSSTPARPLAQSASRKRVAAIAFPPEEDSDEEGEQDFEDYWLGMIPEAMELYGPYIRPLLSLGAGLDPERMARDAKELEWVLQYIVQDVQDLQHSIRSYLKERDAACCALKKLIRAYPSTAQPASDFR